MHERVFTDLSQIIVHTKYFKLYFKLFLTMLVSVLSHCSNNVGKLVVILPEYFNSSQSNLLFEGRSTDLYWTFPPIYSVNQILKQIASLVTLCFASGITCRSLCVCDVCVTKQKELLSEPLLRPGWRHQWSTNSWACAH